MSSSPTSIAMDGKSGGKRATFGSKLTTKRLKNWLYPRDSIDDLLNPLFYMELFIECVLCAYTMACVIWCLMTLHPESYSPSTTHFGLFAGFIIMLLIEAYGPLTGAPINPAGCWGFFIAGRISLARSKCHSISHL